MDGAHLKGKYKGTILHAVAMDGNNQILLIGYGIFPKETTDSWTWFLEKRHECIDDVEGLTMVTNRAPPSAVSIQNVFPNAQHGLCCFHLIGNIVHTFGKNKKNSNLFWKLVIAYKTTEFEFYWGRLRNIRDGVATYLSQIPREKWTGAYYLTTRYDSMTSNSAESMNVVSNKARKLPILPLLEFFCALMQKWFYKRRMVAEKGTTKLMKWAEDMVKKNKEGIQGWLVSSVDNTTYQVHDFKSGGIVNLREKTCSCRY
uniref:MULE transposase domain-containing protein n=1 Tax=Lactuca sativa TaxID=4236 RepID=A0A9R1XS43_LACSA|nr:hypothetical protein LSAT_V11C200079600 [Lactuca sativa]